MEQMSEKIKWLLAALVLILSACSPANQAASTPTIVPLDRTGVDPASQVANRLPTATPIPPPSPTATLTPFPTPTMPGSTPTADSVKPRAEVITSGLNVRTGPGLNYPTIGTVSTGDQLKVTGISPAGDWLQVVIDETTPGWVSALPEYVRLLSVARDELPIVEPPLPPDGSPASAPTASSSARPESLPGKLIFTTSSGGELYAINLDGTGLRRLAAGVIDPVLSPDGQQVAFMRWDGANMATLYTINIDGTNEQAVLNDIRKGKSPTWSPDGQQIVISFQHGGLVDPPEVCKEFDADDGFRLPRDIGEITKSRFSEGKLVICYIRIEDLHWGLRQIEVATGKFEDLPVEYYSFNPTWDPNNPWRVIYDGEKGLVQFDVTNNKVWPITTDLRDTAPVFSPDGRTLALTYKQHDHWEVYTLDLETGQHNRLTKPPILAEPQYNSAAPAWSPDGSQLAFVTDRTGRWEIWVMNADGSNPHPLFSPEIQVQLGLEYHGVNERMLNWTK
jgi:hypothetical protein